MSRVPPADPTAPPKLALRVMSPFVRSAPGSWFFKTVSSRIDAPLMSLTGGRFNSGFGAVPSVVLTSIGAKSGEPRSVPLAYFTDGEDVILMASSFGRPKPPLWYRNLTAHAECELWVGKRGGRYVANETTGEDRERLFALAKRLYEGYGDYELRVAGIRTIPVLRLTPAD